MAIFLDIETLDFFQDEHIKSLPRDKQLEAMRFGIAVTIDDEESSPRIWREADIIELYNYLVWCGKAVVGWNIDSFDLPVIVHSARRAGWDMLEIEHETIRTFDLFAEIRKYTNRWYKLETVCQSTLGRGKLADGQRAAEWLRSGDTQKAIEYCTDDVTLVQELHNRFSMGQRIILPPRPERGEINRIDWWIRLPPRADPSEFSVTPWGKNGGFERIPGMLGAVSTK